MRRLALLSLVTLACSSEPVDVAQPRVTDIFLSDASPTTLIPGTRLFLHGGGFLPGFAGPTAVTIRGEHAGEGFSVTLPATFDDYDRIHLDWPGAAAVGLPADTGTIAAEISVSIDNAFDGALHESAPTPFTVTVAPALEPSIGALEHTVTHVNDPVVVQGDGFLLGGLEGETVAIVSGCFTAEGESECVPVGPAEVTTSATDRGTTTFPFAPSIAGIRSGTFSGTVQLENRHGQVAGHVVTQSGASALAGSIAPPFIAGFAPSAASLGQFVDISGAGFVGTSAEAVTIIDLSGTFTPVGGDPMPANVSLVPEHVGGQLVRYVVNEEDALGQAIDLRTVAGSFTGTATPIVEYQSDSVAGASSPVTLGLAHVKQVVWLRFLPSYVESLRHFGLREADAAIRARVADVVRRDYAGVNLEVRLDEPLDFALYAEVEIGGPDPNGIGLLGYDNTPGKDVGNQRLYDKIGGVNAVTQEDGFPGYGGVFVESLFTFSTHPGSFASDTGAGAPLFDAVFDPFRPDVGGSPVAPAEATGDVTVGACPAADRQQQVSCAVRTLAALIGTTVAHEIAHSLGLADPGGEAFHNAGDGIDRLMDAGTARSFEERAELGGAGPGVFCRQNFDYLRVILPSADPDPLPQRPDCF